MSMKPGEPVFAVNGWEFHQVIEHDALVFKFFYTRPPHAPNSKLHSTQVFSLPAAEITNLISVLRESLEILRSGDEDLSIQKDLH